MPGGFGDRGIEGKIIGDPLCAGTTDSVLRHLSRHAGGRHRICPQRAGLAGANSSEIDPATPYPVIDLLPEQKDIEDLGGTMRLGLYPCKLAPGTLAMTCYGDDLVYERHRHRYEFNNEYREQIEAAGLRISGTSPDGRLVEMIELPDHPWFLAVQFHPEFTSRPNRPQPLFRAFVASG